MDYDPKAEQASTECRSARLAHSIAATAFLPPAFEMIPRLLVLLDDPESNSEALADLIRVDSGLTADVLQVANSAAYSGAVRMETISQAIMRVGLREIYRTVMKIVASPVLSDVEQPGFAKLELWRHSIGAAVAAQILARDKGENPEVAFTAGLLHDVGKLALGQAFKRDYMNILERSVHERTALWTAEQQTLDTDHAEVGAKLLKRWNFPDHLIFAVAFHHDPRRSPKPYARLAAITHAANLMAYRIDCGYGRPDYVINPDPSVLRLADLTAEELKSYDDEVRLAAEREQETFR